MGEAVRPRAGVDRPRDQVTRSKETRYLRALRAQPRALLAAALEPALERGVGRGPLRLRTPAPPHALKMRGEAK
jgi:hypothetical protein